MDLKQIATQQTAAAVAGAVLQLRYNNGEPIPDAWIKVRGAGAPELRALMEKNKRQAANLIAAGKEKQLHDVDRANDKINELLALSFIEASPKITYQGEPLTAANIGRAVADPEMKTLLADPMLVFCSDSSNFPEATATTSTSLPTSPSTSSPASSPASSATPSASSN